MKGLSLILRETIVKHEDLRKKVRTVYSSIYWLLLIIDFCYQVLVIPAFETQRYTTMIPKSKRELISMWDKKLVHTFRYDVWASGHAATNYTKWRQAITPYKVRMPG